MKLLAFHSPPLSEPAVCPTHGAYESRCFIGTSWVGCPACSVEAIEAEQAAAIATERAAKTAAWTRKIGTAGIPERFRDRRLSTYVATSDAQRRALAFAQAYADDFDSALKTGRSALFVGRIGTGKTHLAVGIGMQIMERDNRSVLFTTVMRAVRRVKDTWTKGSKETESGAVAALVFPDFLILDEVGVQFGSDTERLILFDILNERYERRRPTLLMSNLTVGEVAEHLGERVMDRLREDNGEFIPFDWESNRKGGVA